MILVVFHTAGINEKKKKKNLVQNLDGLGAGLGIGRAGWARGTQA